MSETTSADRGREQVHELLARAYSDRTDEAFDRALPEWRQAWFDDTEGMVDVVLAYGEQVARAAVGKALREAADAAEGVEVPPSFAPAVFGIAAGLRARAADLMVGPR